MNGIQIEHLLDLIDSNIQASMELVRPQILKYLTDNGDELARQIAEKGFGEIPTSAGVVRVTQEDLKAA